MKRKTMMFVLASLASLGLAVPCMAEDDVFETEITIDLSDVELEDGAELDLSELFEDEDIELEDLGEDETSSDEDLFGEDDSVYWYTVRYNEDGKDMIMLNDVILYLPEDWTGKYEMILNDNNACFYHKASKAGWFIDGGTEGGLLFCVCTSTDESYKQNVTEIVDLGEGSDGLYYYLSFPSDVQAYMKDEAITQEYEQLYSEIDQVKDEAFCLNDYFVGDEMLEEFTEAETEA